MKIVPHLHSNTSNFAADTSLLASLEDVEIALTAQQRTRIENLTNRFFSSIDTSKLGFSTKVEHKIITNSTHIKSRYYPVSPVNTEGNLQRT